ncbi:MAG: RsmD family RNA methyltransferase [Trueperaceae bacterium]
MSKPRIIAGTAKGRFLETPKRGTRPSPSRLREALFNILQTQDRGTFLDLFSGSGAIGLEAASRGWQVTCVDLSKEAAKVIQQNAKNLKLTPTVIQGDALKFATTTAEHFDIVFAAPPYPLDLLPLFKTIYESNIASELFIFQHPTGLELPYGDETRSYGSNAVTFIKKPGSQEETTQTE